MRSWGLPRALGGVSSTRQPLAQLHVELTDVSELRIYKLLGKLNPSKACGPDETPNCMLKGYAEILAFPITRIISTSLQQRLPAYGSWQMYDHYRSNNKWRTLKLDLRPISLTPCLSKVAEDCAVIDYVKSAVLKVLDPDNSTGRFPSHRLRKRNFSHMVHCWAKETVGNVSTVGTILYYLIAAKHSA